MSGLSIRAVRQWLATYCLTAAISMGLGIAGGLFLVDKYHAKPDVRELSLSVGCANDICMA